MNQTNETRQLVVEFGSLVETLGRNELYPFGPETHLFLAQEQVSGADPIWIVVNPPEWNYSNVNALCCDRAWRAEAGELLLDGKRVIAESYLKAWRRAMANPISFPELLQRGFSLTAVVLN